MEIRGKIIAVLEEKTGEGKNGTWHSQDAVLETADQYPKKVSFNMYGDKIVTLQIGQEVKVSFDIESKEYNGRWFTNLKAWKVETNKVIAEQQSSATTPKEDLPF